MPSNPAPPQQKWCPTCGKILQPDALLCTRCGHHLKTGRRIARRLRKGHAGRPAAGMGLALALGAAAAAAGGVAWALLATHLDFHVGYVAWAIGLAVAAAMALVTPLRGQKIVCVAVGLVAAGIVLGKLTGIFLQAGPLALELAHDPDALERALLDDLIRSHEIDPETARVVTDGPDDATTTELFDKARQTEARLREKLPAMSLAEKQQTTFPLARRMLAEMNWRQRIERQTSFFDAIWALLAVASAWFVLRGVGTAH